MPRSVSDEEIVLKKRARRRLIGAIALVTLVVVLLPMFLDSEPKPLNQEISIQIPPESSQFSSRIAVLPPPPVQGGAKAGADPKGAESPQPAVSEADRSTADGGGKPAEAERRASEQERRAEPEKRQAPERTAKQEVPAKAAPKAEPKPAPKVEPKPAAEASKEKPKEKEGSGESFVVQVAAYADADRARTLKGRITDNGLRAYTEVVKTARGDVTRVRVGPFGSKEAAQKAADDLKKIGLSGVVAPKG